MKYSRNFIPLREHTPGFGRGGMIPHGIARMEQHEDAIKLRINIYGLSAQNGPYRVYAVGISDKTYRKNELGQLLPDALGRCELGYRSILRGDESYGIRVLVVALEDGTEILIGYIGNPVDWHTLRDIDEMPTESETLAESVPEEPEKLLEEEADAREEEETIQEEAEEPQEKVDLPEAVEALTDPEETVRFSRQEPESEPEPEPEPEAEEEELPAASESAMKDALAYMFHSYPRIYPFRGCEEKWIRIHPRDLAPLPVDVVALESSPFLQRGYLQYKHLILGCDDVGGYYVGVPFRYHADQEEIGHNWGFTEFRNSVGSKPTPGDYGYWLLPVHMQEYKIA